MRSSLLEITDRSVYMKAARGNSKFSWWKESFEFVERRENALLRDHVKSFSSNHEQFFFASRHQHSYEIRHSSRLFSECQVFITDILVSFFVPIRKLRLRNIETSTETRNCLTSTNSLFTDDEKSKLPLDDKRQ